MAVRFAVASGNWSNAAIWSGSLIPTASDDVYSNTFTVNMDTSFQVLSLNNTATTGVTAGGSYNFNTGNISGSVTSYGLGSNLLNITNASGTVEIISPSYFFSIAATQINHSGNGDFILRCSGMSVGGCSGATGLTKSGAGTMTIYGNISSIGCGSAGSFLGGMSISNGNTIIYGNVQSGTSRGGGGTITVSGTARLTVVGNVDGNNFSNNGYAIATNSPNSTLIISGSVTGTGVTAAGAGSTLTTTGITIISGSVAGGFNTGASINANNDVIVTGNVTATTSPAISQNVGGLSVRGTVLASTNVAITSTAATRIEVSGSVQASATAVGISSTNASAVVNLAGNIVNVNGKQAIYCQNLFLDNTATTQARFFTFGGSDRTLYSSDTFPNLPSSSNVRFGTTYGPGSGNTGTLRMASPQDVRSGVLTANTTGSAILSMESLSNEIQTSSDPFAQRLRNISTVDIIGNLLTAFKK